MTTISKDAQLITLINVFTVDPSNQSQLVELLTQVTDTFVRRARGFISSTLHRSRDIPRSRCMRSGVVLTITRRCEGTRDPFLISRRPSPSRPSSPGSTTWSSHSRRRMTESKASVVSSPASVPVCTPVCSNETQEPSHACVEEHSTTRTSVLAIHCEG